MTVKSFPTIALTAGEPAGIGPDLCIQIAQRPWPCKLVVIADHELLQIRAQQLRLPLRLIDAADTIMNPHQPGNLHITPIPLAEPVQAGRLNPRNADYVLTTLREAVKGCQSGQFNAMVTAPVHKGIINEAHIPFTGHTEFLAELTHSAVVMMLVGGNMRVTLATTHLPLKDVAAAITADTIAKKLSIIHRDLVTRFKIPSPCIAVAGLNPHAGESGHLGREEIDIIIPVLNQLRAEGMNLIGPLPADTLFTPAQLQHYDCVFAMYHDQGLPVLKHASFGEGVNVTLGLPIIRTSVDHGTALELAGSGRAHASSLRAAIELALQLAENSRSTHHAA
ncbi:4-hydroxythreonine-4-phosphate dehydrogenase PdxA [Nitrosomonas sp. JL21]|uniref:4-hydroxythreonine-4-phosphate dehydrogenase PdxA n=1 Tax=Nitrosomonas sp. JL21 TaxID=153949 RepID=UPI001368F392|nr:4-hydroxythreonine-4-phosphate dehydrogenase PdxA [Nitrosomonas sp. JL21]MBL8498750.1 4-hydroxythreonine-4-phosphate dehydrogenase PdxA [Nitrosomonas sp.]MCC7092055.1 4-hydroxythreonine-4-phosphate dehydrogenase PdxA [Nitrosomonas sp.]MXS78081.1 4-hydroxythreonine-4-phosphate dehydrogenase PdxA [Nitrosomonas sp. JL21]